MNADGERGARIVGGATLHQADRRMAIEQQEGDAERGGERESRQIIVSDEDAREVDRARREDLREGDLVRAPYGQAESAKEDQQAERDHHDGHDLRLQHAPQDEAFGGHARKRHQRHADENGEERRQTELQQGIGDVGAQHGVGALGEIHHAGAFVDQHDAERDQRVDAARGDAGNGELKGDHQASPR